jgi:DNA-binding IclR family transcriptional regulator
VVTVQALDRIVAILEVVSRHITGASPKMVAAETGLSFPTTARLLNALKDEDLVARSSDNGRYRIGPRLINLVARSTHAFDSRVAAEPLLEQVRDSTNETVALFIRDGQYRVCIAAAHARHAFGRIVPLGVPLPLVGSAVGLVLMAQMDDGALERLLPTLDGDGREQLRLRRSVEEVQTKGWASSSNTATEGVSGVAVPVGGLRGSAAISVSGPSERFDGEKMLLARNSLLGAADKLASLSWPSGEE